MRHVPNDDGKTVTLSLEEYRKMESCYEDSLNYKRRVDTEAREYIKEAEDLIKDVENRCLIKIYEPSIHYGRDFMESLTGWKNLRYSICCDPEDSVNKVAEYLDLNKNLALEMEKQENYFTREIESIEEEKANIKKEKDDEMKIWISLMILFLFTTILSTYFHITG